MKAYGILILILVTILGCASPYQPNGLGGGFSETQLAPELFRVAFRGNGYTSSERAQDFTILRAAELTLQNGFTCFAVIDETASTDVSRFTTPGSSQTTGSVYVQGDNYGNYSGMYSGQSTYMPPTTHYIFRPRSGLLIRCFAEKPEDVYTFDAEFLMQSLKGKYKID